MPVGNIQSGLGDNFYIGGYDLSGDISSVDSISGAVAVLEATALKQSAESRLYGLRSGIMKFTSLFENSVVASSPAVPLSTVPYVSTYNVSILVTIVGTVTNVSINGVTAGTSAGTYLLPAFGSIALTYSSAPTWTWLSVGTMHNALAPLPRSQAVCMYVRGATQGNAVACMTGVQVNYDGTRDNNGNLNFQVEVDAGGYGYEWGYLLTSGVRTDTAATVGAAYDQGAALATTNYGAQGYLEILDFIGTSVDITITHCTTTGGTYTTLMDFGSQTGIGGFRQSVSNVTAVNEFIKIVTTGTFTYCSFAVAMNRNLIAGQVF
jgi:hypothetical protein